ncbi:MAG TPA: hypothetical protein VM094_04085, partial [Gemmatimonadales bacterium]|nr:hypothetical protein [Gemmatimonadales bacterium]
CHRDLQPDNFFIRQDGQPVVLDFGACLPPIFDTITTPGELIGSPYSISPEYVAYLLAGRDREHYVATPAEDVYALGVTLYAILTGTMPYQAHAAIALLHEIRSGAPSHPCDVRPDAKVPRPLGDFALTLMEKDPAKRPHTALLVAGRLKGLLTEAERQLWGRTPEQRPAPTAASSVRLRDEVEAEVECMPPRAVIEEAAALASAAERPSGPLAAPGPVSTIDYPVPWEASMPLVRNRTLQLVAASVFTVLMGLLLYTAQHAVSTSRQVLELARELAASAVEPLSALAVTGISMPEKPLPKWMVAPPGTKPGTVCPGTNRRLIAYRGACWTSAYNSRRLDDPKALCPDTWFDPPAEALPEHKDFCFYPVAPGRPGAATP